LSQIAYIRSSYIADCMIYQIKNAILYSDNIDELQSAMESTEYFKIGEPIPAVCILHCTQGRIQVSINNETHLIQAHDMFVCQPNFLLGHYMRTPDCRARAVCAHEHLFDDLAVTCFNFDPKWWEKLLFVQRHPVLHLDDTQELLVTSYFNLLDVNMRRIQKPYGQQILKATAQSAALEMLAYLDDAEEVKELSQADTFSKKSSERVFRKFIDLLHSQVVTHRDVIWYASQLAVTPKYLSAVCKKKSGKTAFEFINELAVEHVRNALMNTDDSIKEIAFKMDFPSTSFFCKYVRKHLGQSPMEFRKLPISDCGAITGRRPF